MMVAQQIVRRPAALLHELGRQLSAYRHWRDDLIDIINEYHCWIEQHGLATREDDLRLFELLDALHGDKLVVALVGEFSRGKTELINAIFFADYRQRLLPSDAGRTTMCPTELRYDDNDPPGLRLLPIETRERSTTLAEYRRMPSHWSVLPLDLDSPKKMSATFREITRTKAVDLARAEELGLYHPRLPGAASLLNGDGTVQIPVWRHAVINYPHPLLKQGLVVLDTPGLNALGIEPELTLHMLPDAHALLFVLAADTGVTRSDLEMWNHHVCVAHNARGPGRIVVLNKIDVLWDELRADSAIAATVSRQRQETARTLGVDVGQVFAVSAHKGLLGKIKGDYGLIERSALPALQTKLAEEMISAKHALVRDQVMHQIGALIETTGAMIEARERAVAEQRRELEELNGQGRGQIQDLMTRIADERRAYDLTLASFQSTRTVLSEQIKILLDYLSTEVYDELAACSRHRLSESWTTHGLRAGMKALFDGAVEAMDKANEQAQQVRGLVQAIYHKFHSEHGLAKIAPAGFSLLPHRSQLQRLYDDAEAFRNSPAMVLSAQRYVIQRFFASFASRARELFGECHTTAGNWSKAIMAPVLAQVREHKILMDQRLENLKQVHENLDNLGARLEAIESTRQNLENQQLVIRSMLRKIHRPLTGSI